MDIAQLFFEQPGQEFHVREIARLAEISPSTASKRLEELRAQRIIDREDKYNHHVYRSSGTEEFDLSRKVHFLQKLGPQGRKLLESTGAAAIILTERGLVGINGSGGSGVAHYSEMDIAAMKRMNPDKLNELVNGLTIAGVWRLFK